MKSYGRKMHDHEANLESGLSDKFHLKPDNLNFNPRFALKHFHSDNRCQVQITKWDSVNDQGSKTTVCRSDLVDSKWTVQTVWTKRTQVDI